MPEQKVVPAEFVTVTREEGMSLLKEAVRVFASAIVWTKNQAVVVNSHLAAANEAEERLYVWIPGELDPRQLHKDIMSSNEQVYFSLSLSRANILFRAQYEGLEDLGLKFHFPDVIYKIQRRKNFRLPIPDGYTVKVELGGSKSKKVLDISAGGLSFLAGADEAQAYPAGLTFNGAVFRIKGRDIKVDLVVRHVKELSGRVSGTKVGCEFATIRPGDAQHIASYVFEESRKYLSKVL